MSDDEIIKDIQYNISMNVARYAKKKGISYQEAASKAYAVVGGVKIQPFDAKDSSFSLGIDGEPKPEDLDE